jgi:starch-binding outer membrane protein, SusD/RagB family
VLVSKSKIKTRRYMKNTLKIIFTIIALFAFTASCNDSFLDVTPTASIGESELTSKPGIEGSLIGVYSMLSGRGGFYAGATNWFWGSVLGGDANKGSNSGDQSQVNEIQSYKAQTTNESVLQKYQTCYDGIARANRLLKILPDGVVDVGEPNYKVRIEGEARFLRAFYYFELKKIFDNTPYIDESVDYNAGINLVKNDVDLWTKIEADLDFAYANLAETQTAAGRANKWAAASLLAKAYLFQKKYTQAKTLFDLIIANGKTANGKKYALLPKYGDVFRAASDNSAESVFAIQSAAGTGSINNANPDFVLNYPYNGGPAGCCGFNQPSFELANSFRTDNTGLPLLDGSYNTGANQLKTDQGIPSATAFVPDNGNLDPRLDHSVGRRGLPYLDHGKHPGFDWIRDQTYGGPFAPKKWIYTAAELAAGDVDKSSWTTGYTAVNYPVIRYADVLLMAAEVEVEIGNLETARGYVNQIRARASNPAGFVLDGATPAANYVIGEYTSVWADQAIARNAVRFERKLELSGEGHRFFDLVRWGIAETTLNAYITYERPKVSASFLSSSDSFTSKSEYLPIPQREIDIVGKDVLSQNEGY